MSKDYYSWSEFDADVKKISKWARGKRFKNIYGLPRGGLPLAVSLSHGLGLPLIWDKEKISGKTLIVDDIADTGKTLKRLLGKKKVTVVTIYLDKQSVFMPDLYCRLKDGWIVFPWETERSSKYDKTI